MGALARSRAWANQVLVRRKARSIARRARRDRTLVVALNRDGSVQQFYHFLLGFYAPLCVWLSDSGAARPRIRVRDCGPMTPWFDTLADRADIQVVPPGAVLRQFAGRSVPRVVLRGLDDTRRFRPAQLRRARGAMLDVLRVDAEPGGPAVVVIDRATSDDFSHSTESENPMSGSERRSVPNLAAVSAEWKLGRDVVILDTAQLAPREQVRRLRRTRVLVGQHGAGLAHMIRLDPGAVIVEIHPPLPPEVVGLFPALAAALGHHHLLVPQDDVHAPVDPQRLEQAVREAVALAGL